ncbi:hypothetical protein [Microvirga sp. G4-2]|uniref:hypothetical protein n=1 Tax=Microvirga sp. G4-2 TaxID=3434467 RepID=UPI004044D86E
MSTLQISTPIAADSFGANPRRPGPLLRALHAVIAAMAETNRRRAEREIARVDRIYGIGSARH